MTMMLARWGNRDGVVRVLLECGCLVEHQLQVKFRDSIL